MCVEFARDKLNVAIVAFRIGARKVVSDTRCKGLSLVYSGTDMLCMLLLRHPTMSTTTREFFKQSHIFYLRKSALLSQSYCKIMRSASLRANLKSINEMAICMVRSKLVTFLCNDDYRSTTLKQSTSLCRDSNFFPVR